VKKSPEKLKEMQKVAGGGRSVPVIVDGGQVTVGYGGT
jgi:glutaredoxin